LPNNNGQQDTIAGALADISDRLTQLVHDEIDLAKAEMADKAKSLAAGAAMVAIGAVFGVFALIFLMLTLAWGLNSLLGSIWLGFVITFGVLVVSMAGLMLFAWRKLKVGAPTPTMAIDEAKKIKDTVTAKAGVDI
jgi:protein-S-isoprenylcysteine O-methyltransferase Ste14